MLCKSPRSAKDRRRLHIAAHRPRGQIRRTANVMSSLAAPWALPERASASFRPWREFNGASNCTSRGEPAEASRDEARALQRRKINCGAKRQAGRKMRTTRRFGYLFRAPKPDQRKCVFAARKALFGLRCKRAGNHISSAHLLSSSRMPAQLRVPRTLAWGEVTNTRGCFE